MAIRASSSVCCVPNQLSLRNDRPNPMIYNIIYSIVQGIGPAHSRRFLSFLALNRMSKNSADVTIISEFY